MIDSENFKGFVKNVFSFLVSEFRMKLSKETINGNAFYDIEYKDKEKIISISLESIENYYQVILFKLDNGEMPDYDDKTKTIHLNALNKKTLMNVNKVEFELNNQYFNNFETKNETERIILKSAKDLRINLKHLNE